MNTFVKKLKDSGYTKPQASEIMRSGIVGYKNKWDNLPQRHRTKEETEGPRRLEKLTGKTRWFKSKAKVEGPNTQPIETTGNRYNSRHTRPAKHIPTIHQQPSSVMFVERTPGGALAQELREMERDLNLRET